MSTTGEVADVHESGHHAKSHSGAISPSSSPDMSRCGECESCSPVFFCNFCKAFLCDQCDGTIHTFNVHKHHVRMSSDDYAIVKRSLGDSSPTDKQVEDDYESRFCFFNPIDRRISLLPRLPSLVADPDARPSLVAFVGPTGAGKSTLLRCLSHLDGQGKAEHMPLVGASNDAQSTSADINIYDGGQVSTNSGAQSGVSSSYPLLYLDSEGQGGSKEPRAIQGMWKHVSVCVGMLDENSREVFAKRRLEHVQTSYPRMLYIFSDVLCFVFSGNWREHRSILDPLLYWARSAAAGAVNQHRPQLILIFTKTGKEASELKCNGLRGTYEIWVEGVQKEIREELDRYYLDPIVCLIPHADINPVMMLDEVANLRKVIHDSTAHIRESRKQGNQLFTRRQLQFHMHLAAETFSTDPNAVFDIHRVSMARRPASVGLGECIVQFRRQVEKENPTRTRTCEKYRISLRVLQMRMKSSVLLWLGRLNENHPVGVTALLPEDLRTELDRAQAVIDGEQPCSAMDMSFRPCDTVRLMHDCGRHASSETVRGQAVSWKGDFTSDEYTQREVDACRLVNLAEKALKEANALNVKEIRGCLSEIRRSQCDEHHWLKSFNPYHVCVSCMVELPTEVLSCGHIICCMCANEEATTCARMTTMVDLKCPVCLSSAKWYRKVLPPYSGYRILSLDGGGVRGIVELLSLQEIMSFFPGMQVNDLFDIIVGTSTGGIIALALTVHAFDEEPKSLPDVMRLFQSVCNRAFSKKMRNFGAKRDALLRIFQILRIYDTKYKNANLLKVLEEHLGTQPLLKSCVGGPHVIVTSCERDNNLAAAWFTSYNSSTLDNDNCYQFKVGPRDVKELPNRALLSGRVCDNYHFSAKDVAAATSAAGTYFPAYEAGDRFWIDGGMRFNCPASIAIEEARSMWPKNRASALISLGCGSLVYEDVPKPSDSLLSCLDHVVDVATDADLQYRHASKYLSALQPSWVRCSLRLNPTIMVPKGKKCNLDSRKQIPFLMEATKKYLRNDGRASVEEAANVLFAALFYVDFKIDDTAEQHFSIRSHAALPESLRNALIAAINSPSPPFSVTVPSGVKSEFMWTHCTWDKDVMNLPFVLSSGVSYVNPPDAKVSLDMRLPGTSAPQEMSLLIGEMPTRPETM